MFLLDGGDAADGRLVIVTSASDLTVASSCEFAFLRTLDAKLGWAPAVEVAQDPMLARASRLGDRHELRTLERYREEFGTGAVEIDRPESMASEHLRVVADASLAAFHSGAPVVFQATFFDDGSGDVSAADAAADAGTDPTIAFIGFADFVVRQPDGSYLVEDAKLARRAKVTALLQVAAYAEQLERIGVTAAPTARLLLGDGSVSEHRLSDIVPVFHKRRDRLHHIIREHVGDPSATPVAWGDPRYVVCGHCDACTAEIERSRDVLLVAGLRVSQRARLAEAGIRTIDQLAALDREVDGIAERTLTGLREQARLQSDAVAGAAPPVRVKDADALAAIPTPDAGDIFFDFEGDPLYTEGGDESRWGIDYLFGWVDAAEGFHVLWAHDFAAERQALIDFVAFVGEQRRRFPAMHIYHYAPYERTHLASLAARHGVCENEIDELLRSGVLVDLYAIVRSSVRVGSPSYSIKKLEPLYMNDDGRQGEVTNAAASIDEYVDARELIDTGDAGAVEEGERRLDAIASYNEYDCVSTLRLRDWLLDRAREAGVASDDSVRELKDDELPPSPLRNDLLQRAGTADDADRTADERAAAFAAAALDYHAREKKSFWWAHYERLVRPMDEWEDTRDVLVVESGELVRDWFREGKQRSDRRWIRLRGRLAPGSVLKVDGRPFALYEHPGPFENQNADKGARASRGVKVLEVDESDGGILVEETVPEGFETYRAMPSALAPAAPPSAGKQPDAIAAWAQTVLDAAPSWPNDPVSDILRRIPPRTRSESLAARVARARLDDLVASVVETVRDLDSSYLAVQGPPGTGKTYLGAHVIAELAREHHMRIGVVAQSHRVVEHLLDQVVVTAKLDPALVGKVPQMSSVEADRSFTVLPKNGQLNFALDHFSTGFVVGGTAWDFANPARVPPASLDLIVIDEAGQFSLASTIAVSVAARNLLLLGDPQQLPQVSQGTHPEPIDGSALGWISEGHDVLPQDFGYFLAESRRMHPDVARPVSVLSYEGRLRSTPATAERRLDGVPPGLHPVPVVHVGNSTQSPEEAARVVELVETVLGRSWTAADEGRAASPLGEGDVIVVTPYNAQLTLVAEALAAAGHGEVRVGTVDKFQGAEAAVAIVTLAASSAADVPRGMSFLIMKNRLNVAVSRAKWAAYLLYSLELTDYLPLTPTGVAELSAFITLVER